MAKTLQAEVFLTVVALRESLERAKEVSSRRENGEIRLHSNHSHDIELNIFQANTSRVADLPSRIGVLLLIFNRSVERQNGLSRLMDRMYEELSQREIGELHGLQVHYDEYIAEVARAIEYGSLLNQVFAEEYGNTDDVYMEETSEAGVVKIQIVRKS